ncbi:MAG: ABC transporter ATP-binding protein [Candidatus Eisenbacteria bacterium]|nr:ABC transporter ATP-binding protein [Candidatus Eisenbacteria bacterium]
MSELHGEEEVFGKAYDGRLMRRLVRYLVPYRRWVAAALALMLLDVAVQLAVPALWRATIDRALGAHNGPLVDRFGITLVALLLGGFLVQYAQTVVLQRTGQRIMWDLRRQLFTHLQTQPLSFFDRQPVGRLMTRVINDVDVLNELFTSGMVTVIGDVFMLLGILWVLFSWNARLALLTFSVLPLIFVCTVVFRTRVRDSYRKIRTLMSRINSFLQENISGMVTVQMLGREENRRHKFAAINEAHRDANVENVCYCAVFFPVMDFLGALALALLVWFGGRQVLDGALTLGALVAFFQYAQRFFRPINDLAEKYTILQSAMASAERVFDLLDTEPALKPAADPKPAGPLKQAIRFEDVWFAYNGEDFVLRDVNLAIRPGEKIAVVGATGSGKTTLVHLLARFYEVTRGRITWDGVDIRELSTDQLRRRIGFVQQDVFLFSGNIRDNIGLRNAEISPGRVEDAAREVQAGVFIDRLPAGMDTAVNERGTSLSTGERQLLAFARALAYDPEVLVLDEATSSVDPETEHRIQEALERLLRGRTSIVIAHRLSTIQSADRILVFHRGKLREAGTHSELIAREGIYARLVQLQYGGAIG